MASVETGASYHLSWHPQSAGLELLALINRRIISSLSRPIRPLIPVQPINNRLADVSLLPDQPAKILRAAAGLLARADNVSGWHGRSGSKQPDAPKRRLLEPASGWQAANEPDHGHFAAGKLERMIRETFEDIKGRISNDVGDFTVGTEKISFSPMSTIDNI